MKKAKTVYVCSECDYQSAKWMGRCPGCGSWNTFVEETYEAGIELCGTEVKSLRAGRVNLKDSWCSIVDGEIFVNGMHISPYEQGNIFNRDPMRKKRLLLHKKEIMKLFGASQQRIGRAAKGKSPFHGILQVALTFQQNVLRKVLLSLQKVGKQAFKFFFVVHRLLFILFAQFCQVALGSRIFGHGVEQRIVVKVSIFHSRLCLCTKGCEAKHEAANK